MLSPYHPGPLSPYQERKEVPVVGDTVRVVKNYGYGDSVWDAIGGSNPIVAFRVTAQYAGPPGPVPGAGMPYRGGPINELQVIDIFTGALSSKWNRFTIEDSYCQVLGP